MRRNLITKFSGRRAAFLPVSFVIITLSILTGGFASKANAQSPLDDDFNETSLNTSVWKVVAPVGGGAAVSNGHLVITVPKGSNHDGFTPALDAVQVEQLIGNVNFDVNVKIDSTLAASAAYSGQGLMVEGDAHDYIRFELGAGGSSIQLSANTIVGGTQTAAFQLSPFSGYVVPTYLRLNRTGTTYTGYWSSDGVNWNKAGSFTDSLTVTGLAPYGWNYQSTPSNAPAVTASFDWFHNTTTTAMVATPTFNPPSGASFTSTLSVSLADSTSGSTIYYTTDGSMPTTSSQVYSNPITLNATTTIQAFATANGSTQSGIASATYTQTAAVAATPAISPASGTSFSSTLSVSMTDSTSGSTIYYTTDGSTPSSTTSTAYTTPFTVSATTTVNAIAIASGLTQSSVASATYTLTSQTSQTPVADDFNETSLNTSVWKVVAPVGGGAAVSNGHLVITVPKGSNHDGFTPALDAVQVEQLIGNVNFDVNVKIDSTLAASAAYSGQGLMVEGDAHDYIRFELGAGGSSIQLSANTIVGGTQTAAFQLSPFSGYVVPTYLRLNRTGTTYTGYWSSDGVNWNKAGSFTDSLTVTGLAPYGWNYQSTPSNAPAVTASFDWFHNTTTTPMVATPTFNPPSGASFTSTLSVSLADSTSGSTIYYTTDGSMPTTSSQVYSNPITLNATTTIQAFATANGSTQSGIASATYTQTAAVAATPAISPASGTSFSSTLSVSMTDSTSGSTIYYTTDGSTPSSTTSTAYTTPFTISATTTVKVIAIASGLTQSSVTSATYTLTSQTSQTPVADDFNGTSINTNVWTFVAPVGGSIAVSNGHLIITVPGGSNHDAFTPALDAVQLEQFISNVDFDVNVKIDSTLVPSAAYSGEGILVEGDAHNYIRFGLGSGGSSVGLGVNTIINGTEATAFQLSPFSGYVVPTYLRLNRTGTTYTGYWSSDGVNWNKAGSFTDSLTVTGLAPYGWNYQSTPSNAPAVTASFDWFHNTTTTPMVATPTFNPPSGASFTSTLSVSLADSMSGSTIYYTTDGSMPTTSSQVYSNRITLNATTTIQAFATDNGFTQSGIAYATYTLLTVTGGSAVSDNFDSDTLNTSLWTIEDPLGDGTVAMNGSGVTLNVPGCEAPAEAACPQGKTHDATTSGDNTVRIVQSVANSDLSVDVRFESAVEVSNQDEGIMVEQDSGDFLRFDVLNSGTAGPRLFAAGITGGTESTFINAPIALPSGPLVLRLSRTGNVWTGSWSGDGINFNTSPSFTFSLNVAHIGPYAGSSGVQPAFTAVVDYFFNTANPIENNDGPLPFSYVTVDANPAGTLVEKALADIEGTGQLNPVIGLESENANGSAIQSGVYWYQYPASGNLNDVWTRHTIIASGDAYEDMIGYDVNGDGAVDIIASYRGSGTVQIVWFQNPRGNGGNPATDPWTLHVIGPGIAEDNLLLKDIDGDGKIDVVTPSYIFFQNSSTSWTALQYSTSGRGIALLDIGSGNGSINLAGTQPSSPFNQIWYENPRETGGNARTGNWIMHTIGAGYPCNANSCPGGDGDVSAFQSMDVDGDGRMDVITAQSEGPGGGVAPPPGGVIWWQAPQDRRNGSWTKHTIDANMVDVHKVGIGDMDQNGTLDIVVAEQDQAPLTRVGIYYNDGKGNFTLQVVSNAKGHNDALGSVTGKAGELDILNSGHGYFNDAHPLQIFLNPY